MSSSLVLRLELKFLKLNFTFRYQLSREYPQ